jgi:class 3 adenylate cyclase
VAAIPETRFAKLADGAQVAYQAVGDGPIDIIVARMPNFPVDLMWDEPHLARFLERLSTFSRHIWFDPRGIGASDGIALPEARIPESAVEDMVAVLDDLGCERAAVLGLLVSSAMLFAATHPERTNALVIADVQARARRAEDYPYGVWDEGELSRVSDEDALFWRHSPSLAADERFRLWASRAWRLAAKPADHPWRRAAILDMDVRAALPAISAPTLAVIKPARRTAAGCRWAAEQIAGARIVEVPGEDLLFFAGDPAPVLDAIEEFLTGRLPLPDADRVLATVLFTDVVGSTEQAARLGDRRWKEVLAEHDRAVGAELERFRGRRVKSTGDGVLATFDGPGRAIRCSCAIRDAVRVLGIGVRAGLHTGEIELRGDEDVAGVAVHIGARVSALAGAGEVLVSSTVKDLVTGSGIEFEDRGERELKGVPGTWHLYAVNA